MEEEVFESEETSEYSELRSEIERDLVDRVQESGPEAQEAALGAMAFVESLHQMFVDNGMSKSDEPDLDELENLIDALHGELGAAVLFLCDPSFARVPDMLRAVSAQLEKDAEGTVPTVVVKGFARLARRIENTRVNMQQLATKPARSFGALPPDEMP